MSFRLSAAPKAANIVVVCRLLAAAGLLAVTPASAQNQDFFVPGQQRPAPGAGRPATPQRASPPPRSIQPGPIPQQAGPEEQVNVPMPPVPELPALPKGATPPAAVIGVIGVPEVMRASAAAQAVDKALGERRDKLNEDAQKEQASWRDMQQGLANERTKLSPEQIRVRERELQERITNAQKLFRDRNRIIQEATQVAINQIQASLIGVIRQVSESRGMNLVLHRTQVALNVNEFDITEQVAEQLNKLLPNIAIPPDGVSPLAQKPAVTPTPASAATPPKK
jgi:Skp family chaperone for outer membrane proteins